ncbi:PEP/pyruvate-binding domain-containing protein [Nonomuraea soli]|uniref:Pyruvate,water dikinase n=1 Tax=Nonomuraea soli TaxID=1032476 RepID=A0A7W0CEM4_9ACTN|nr:PEP/pyruvate-binding domain-containing protein [Nonomuraea soli]MBA2889761.1 pyruvate,water dikinase [Nonomuraea soli]
MSLVAPLSAFGKHDLDRAGGKAANLGELVSHGFPVPGGFVVTTDAYALVAAEVDLTAEPAAIRAAFERAEVPAPLRELIAAAFRELGGGPVAVRSSATAEDLPGAAFAGQQDTYLNVTGEDAVIDAVRRCWGSLWTDRAVAYRAKLGLEGEVRIAVVVQVMVEAEFAGVMFTADPVTGARDRIVVDSSAGLGEAVVSGLVTPDHYVLDLDGRVVGFTAGRREVVIRAAAGGGVVHDAASGTPVRLGEAQLAELVRLGRAVAGHYGRPQDTEWAVGHDGTVFLVQARPMTALPPPPVKLNAVERKMGSILLDYLPIRPYPIDMSTWIPHGPVGMMAKIGEHYGLKGVFAGILPEVDGVVDRLVPRAPRPTPKMLALPFRLVAQARRHDPARWRQDPRFTAFTAACEALAAEDLAAMSWEELIRVPRRALDLVGSVTRLRIDYLPGTGLALLRLLAVLTLTGRRRRLGDLIAGASTRTTDANEALERLAGQVRTTPGLAGALTPDGIAAFPEFAASFEAFLAEYGHRETASPILVTPPTMGEQPQTVLDTVRMLASSPPRPGERHTPEPSRLVRAAQAGVAFREDSHFYFTLPLPVLRRSLLEIGRRLAERGVLDAPDDVFHLRLEELESGGDGLRETMTARRARRQELAGVRLIDPRSVFPPREHGDALVSGTPGGNGLATGPVKVIREPSEFGKLEPGDVLVCPYTNPSWTPLFQRAAAVVVDAGSMASHAAIVAREYGIPAIMGSADGTTVLHDGQMVTVDGDTGHVTAAQAPDAAPDAATPDPVTPDPATSHPATPDPATPGPATAAPGRGADA